MASPPRDKQGFRVNPGDEEKFKFDGYTHAVTTITSDHRQVHDGMVFHITNRVASLANAGEHDILVDVPAFTYPHIRAAIFSLSDSPCDIEAYEGTTTSADGSALTALNRNRNSTKTSSTTFYTGPTITGAGTQIHDRYVPDAGGQGSNQIGVITPTFGEEWILKPSTKYLLRLTNNSGGAITLSYEIIWYELSYEQ